MIEGNAAIQRNQTDQQCDQVGQIRATDFVDVDTAYARSNGAPTPTGGRKNAIPMAAMTTMP